MVNKKELKQKITATEVARIWNERAKAEGKEGGYTRFSVYGQKDKLQYIETPLGFLYERSRAEEIALPWRKPRPDVAKKNQAQFKGRKRNKETHKFEAISEDREN